MATTQRIENTQEMALRTRERGHLSLVEWSAGAHPIPVPARKTRASIRRAPLDRLYEGGILLLILSSAFAALACFARL